jgi:hypothetical protein
MQNNHDGYDVEFDSGNVRDAVYEADSPEDVVENPSTEAVKTQ